MDVARAPFLTFEGGEGAGKSTQLKILAARLREHGAAVVETREPGGSPHAEALRELLLEGVVEPFGTSAEALLFAVARRDHVLSLIGPALERGEWVLCDRYVDSTRAYQGVGDIAPCDVLALEGIATNGIMPARTYILDLPIEEGLRRATERGDAGGLDRFERVPPEVHERRRRAFLDIAAREPDRCIVLDAGMDVESLAAEIWQDVTRKFERVIERRGEEA